MSANTRDMVTVWYRDFCFLGETLSNIYLMILSHAKSASDLERMMKLLPANCQMLAKDANALVSFWKEFFKGQTCITRSKTAPDQRLFTETSPFTRLMIFNGCPKNGLYIYYTLALDSCNFGKKRSIKYLPHVYMGTHKLVSTNTIKFPATHHKIVHYALSEDLLILDVKIAAYALTKDLIENVSRLADDSRIKFKVKEFYQEVVLQLHLPRSAFVDYLFRDRFHYQIKPGFTTVLQEQIKIIGVDLDDLFIFCRICNNTGSYKCKTCDGKGNMGSTGFECHGPCFNCSNGTVECQDCKGHIEHTH